jgi:hypothetical protein
MTSKRHFEINWPLVSLILRVALLFSFRTRKCGCKLAPNSLPSNSPHLMALSEGPCPCEIIYGLARMPLARRDSLWPCQKALGIARKLAISCHLASRPTLCHTILQECYCLLSDWEILILFAENSQIPLKSSVISILLTFMYLLALNLLVNNQFNPFLNSTHHCGT